MFGTQALRVETRVTPTVPPYLTVDAQRTGAERRGTFNEIIRIVGEPMPMPNNPETDQALFHYVQHRAAVLSLEAQMGTFADHNSSTFKELERERQMRINATPNLGGIKFHVGSTAEAHLCDDVYTALEYLGSLNDRAKQQDIQKAIAKGNPIPTHIDGAGNVVKLTLPTGATKNADQCITSMVTLIRAQQGLSNPMREVPREVLPRETISPVSGVPTETLPIAAPLTSNQTWNRIVTGGNLGGGSPEYDKL